MRNRALITAVVAVLVGFLVKLASLDAAEQLSEPVYAVKHKTKVPVPMPDGVKLAAEIYRPDAPGKFPALLLLRYFRGGHQNARGEFFAARGYAVALVDCRGRYDSEGTWVPYVNDPQDGYHAQEWLGSQPWCDGKIGTFGVSYNAFTSYMAAPLGSPHLKCIFARSGQQTNFGHLYNDGVMQLNVIFEFGLHTKQGSQTQRIFPVDHPHYRRLPLIDAVDDFPNVQHVKDWFKHSRYDDYWRAYGIKEKYPSITAPGYFITGWYDNLLRENWRNFTGFREQGGSEAARTGSKILVGNWAHGGSSGYPGLLELQLRWYDRWLRGIENGIDREPPIKLYVMGAETWRDEHEWPLARTQFTKLYLKSSGHANSVRGDGALDRSPPTEDLAPDQFVYDPENPVYTLGGQISTHGDVRGAKDRRSAQERDDVLVYTTEPLAEDLEVTGPVELTLYIASSTADTDFTATLSDVHPDGAAIHICEGIRGVTFRESLEAPTPIEPGKVYELKISLWETSMVFKRGHRIRLDVSSSNFPRYARNQNTGLPLGTSAEVKKARQTVYHDVRHPSCLILPVIPAGPDLRKQEESRTDAYAAELEAYLAQWLVEEYPERAAKAWNRDYSSVEAFLKSVEPNRRRWAKVLKPPALEKTGELERRPHEPLGALGAEWLTLPLGGLTAEGLLVVPADATPEKPAPLVIAQHGIGSFPERTFGLMDEGGAYHRYSEELLKAGFAVLAPMNLRSAERRNRIERLCRLADTSLPGIELVRTQRLLDEVLSDPRIDQDRVGMWGLSLGGLATMFWMPLEPRIKVGVVAAWFNHRRNKMVIPDKRYSCFLETREEHAFFDGWLTEFTDSDAVCLICPRPLLIQTGKKDGIAHWPQVIEEFEASREHYEKLGIAERIEMDLHEGGHECRIESGVKFLTRWLIARPE